MSVTKQEKRDAKVNFNQMLKSIDLAHECTLTMVGESDFIPDALLICESEIRSQKVINILDSITDDYNFLAIEPFRFIVIKK